MLENLTAFLIYAFSLKVILVLLMALLAFILIVYVAIKNRRCPSCGSKEWEERYDPCCLQPEKKYRRTCNKCQSSWWV